MRYFIVGLLLLLFSGTAWAQQAATYAQYMFNGLAINPAYAGSHEALSLTALGRFQNVGLPGAPQTQTFSAHSPLLNERVALGMLVVHDNISVINQTGVNFMYAYRLPMRDNRARLSFGMQAGVGFYNAKYSQLECWQCLTNPNYSGTPDPAFSSDIQEARPNIGAGVYYTTQKAYIGLSMPHMVNNVFERGENFETVYQNNPLIFTSGYIFTLNRMLKLKPNVMFMMIDGRPVEFDINANLLFDEVFWFGLSYKSSSQLVSMLQFKINDQLQFGYSYTLALGPIRTVELGTHEVMLNYRFWFHKKGIISPRYF
jgi:type IX secretion system PorP/SprF family membrane protein